MRRYVATGLSIIGAVLLATAAVITLQAPQVQAHCQVPCGIYDDAARITRLREDATTIEKCVQEITTLAGKHEALAVNQVARWVHTKEDHASHIITVVSEYFLTQKVKPADKGGEGYDKYLASLADHHAVMVAAMKTKQTVDAANVEALRKAIDALAKHY
jgi:nickel superoxide dismutase